MTFIRELQLRAWAWPMLVALALAAPSAAGDATLASVVDEARARHAQDPQRALDLTAQALALPAAAGDPARMQAFTIRCWAATQLDGDLALATVVQGLAEAGTANAGAIAAELVLCRGHVHALAGEFDAAARDFDQALADAVRLGAREVEAEALALRGELLAHHGDYADGLDDLLAAYRIERELGRDRRLRYVLNAIANLYSDPEVAEYDKAIDYYRQLAAAHEAARDSSELGTAYYNLAQNLDRLERWDEAQAHYERALALERERGAPLEVAEVERALGASLVQRGRAQQGLPYLESALAAYAAAGSAEDVARARLSRGISLRKLGRLDAALDDLDAAWRYFSAAANERFLSRIADERAQALSAAGRWREAWAARDEHVRIERELARRLREQRTARLRIQFDTQRKEEENLALRHENELRALALRDAGRIRSLQTTVIALATALLVALGVLAARALARARTLRALAETDELTRLPNRRHLYALAARQVEAAREGGTPYSVLALDLDRFKAVNDTHGHAVGDVVLQRCAQACRTALRPGDRVGRIGGEEFVSLLPGASADNAAEIAERMRAAIAAIDFDDVAPGLRSTASIGVAQWQARDRDIAGLVARADAALYCAKLAGRDRVEVADPGPAG